MNSLTDFLKTFKDGANLAGSGREFRSLETEHEKEPSYNAVFDLGTVTEPFSDDLRTLLFVFEDGSLADRNRWLFFFLV